MTETTTRCAVLVVEDDEAVQHLLRTMLKKFCTTVDYASDGEAAIALLQNGHYDIVVLDLMLPKMNGFRVAEAMRTLSRHPKVIVLSAISRYFYDSFPGETILLQKPFEIDQLEGAIRTLQATNEQRTVPGG
ncbi:MAG: response regulator [Acidobacteriota bacterium]